MRDQYGCIIRGDTKRKKLALVFTADEYGEGAPFILDALRKQQLKGSFFLTGNYLRNPENNGYIASMLGERHYIGPHSDKHLLYCDWSKRDSLLVSKDNVESDLEANYVEMAKWGIDKEDARFFMPPFEWYNRRIVEWITAQQVHLVNFTPGLRTAADYTYPEMGERYISSNALYEGLLVYEAQNPTGLNGFIILIHLGTDPRRDDKFYHRLPDLITMLKAKGYEFERIDKLFE